VHCIVPFLVVESYSVISHGGLNPFPGELLSNTYLFMVLPSNGPYVTIISGRPAKEYQKKYQGKRNSIKMKLIKITNKNILKRTLTS
jgi:hypothetical protein